LNREDHEEYKGKQRQTFPGSLFVSGFFESFMFCVVQSFLFREVGLV